MIKRVVVLLLTIGLVFPFPIFSAVIGEFAVVTGDVTVKRAGEVIKPQVKDKVETLDFVQTGKNSNARIVLSDDSTMALGPNSRLEMKQLTIEGGKTTGLFSVLAGLVQTKVVKALGPGSRFEIQTPTAIAGVRGTAWLTLVEFAAQSVPQSSFYSLSQAISVVSTAFPGQAATVVAGNFTVVYSAALPTAAATFSSTVVAGLTATLGASAIPGIAGAAGAAAAGTTAATGTTATGTATGTAAAAGAGSAAGTTAAAGVGVGTVAAATAVTAAVVVGVVEAGKGETTTTHHH